MTHRTISAAGAHASPVPLPVLLPAGGRHAWPDAAVAQHNIPSGADGADDPEWRDFLALALPAEPSTLPRASTWRQTPVLLTY